MSLLQIIILTLGQYKLTSIYQNFTPLDHRGIKK